MTSAQPTTGTTFPAFTLYPVAAVLGGLSATGLQPLGWWWATVAALAAAFALGRNARSPRGAGLFWWLFGLGYFAIGLRWLLEPFQVEAEIYAWMAPFALTGMAGGLALFWAVAGWSAYRILPGSGRAIALVVTLGLAELARAHILTGFPWAGFAQVWVDTPGALSLALIGPQGLGLATLAIAAAIAALRPVPVLAGLTLLTALMLADRVPPPAGADGTTPVVRLIQPNAPQDEKWHPEKAEQFFWRQIEATRAVPQDGRPPELIVWPETAIPQLLNRAGDALAILSDAANGTPVLFGIQRAQGFSYFNSLVSLTPSGAVGEIYDKHHLVPFGEYMPFPALFRSLGITALAQRADSGYAAGTGPRVIDIPGVGGVLPLICYEVIFPAYAQSPDARPRVLVQITNDAWFGEAAGPQQHLAQARMRAIEQGLPLVRAANTGISAVIDARGEVVAALPLGQHGFVDASVPVAFEPTHYARSGDAPVAILLMLALTGLLAARLMAIND